MELAACRSFSACLYAYDSFCVHLDFVLFDRFSGPPSGSYLRPSALVSVVSMITTIAQHTHVSASGRSVPVMHPPRERCSSTRTRDLLGLRGDRCGTGRNSMQLLPRVQTSLSSLKTSTSESSGTLLAVSVGVQSASPSSLYTTHSPLFHASLNPPPSQSAHSAHTQHSGSSDSLLSLLYHSSAVNTPMSPSAFSFIYPFALCSSLFGISILPSHWNSIRFGCIS
jgi:hypothetical protein